MSIKRNWSKDYSESAASQLARVEIRDDRTPEEIAKLQEIDLGARNLKVLPEDLRPLFSVNEWRNIQKFCFSEKKYADKIKLEIEIWKLKTKLAYAESRRPDFMSSKFLKAHAEYVQARRYWRLYQTILEKIETGKTTFKGEKI